MRNGVRSCFAAEDDGWTELRWKGDGALVVRYSKAGLDFVVRGVMRGGRKAAGERFLFVEDMFRVQKNAQYVD